MRDTGVGLQPEHLREIFQKFKQVDKGHRHPYGGAGLGLTISQALATAMGGEIRVQSTFGDGTAFTIELPLSRASIPRLTPVVPMDAFPGLSGSVIWVDDNKVNTMVIALWLKRFGLRTTVVFSGRDALNQIHSEQLTPTPFSWVLMDCGMPEMDGYETTRKIRRPERAGARVPILALTANVLNDARARCLSSAMDGDLSKPVSSDVLYTELAKWLPMAVDPPPPVNAYRVVSKTKRDEKKKQRATMEVKG